MNTSGEVADLMVKEGIQITESATKLAALGAKNLAAIIIAMMQDEKRLRGKTNLTQLLKSDKPLCILQIKEADIHKFNSEAKKYGVLFTAVTDKTNNTGLCDIIAKQEDVTKLNYIMERMGYAAPQITQDEKPEEKAEDKSGDKSEKKSNPRTKEYQSEKRYTARGGKEKQRNSDKPSVKAKINDIKAKQKEKSKSAPQKVKTPKPKGKSRE